MPVRASKPLIAPRTSRSLMAVSASACASLWLPSFISPAEPGAGVATGPPRPPSFVSTVGSTTESDPGRQGSQEHCQHRHHGRCGRSICLWTAGWRYDRCLLALAPCVPQKTCHHSLARSGQYSAVSKVPGICVGSRRGSMARLGIVQGWAAHGGSSQSLAGAMGGGRRRSQRHYLSWTTDAERLEFQQLSVSVCEPLPGHAPLSLAQRGGVTPTCMASARGEDGKRQCCCLVPPGRRRLHSA